MIYSGGALFFLTGIVVEGYGRSFLPQWVIVELYGVSSLLQEV